jgi:hypothetical protein
MVVLSACGSSGSGNCGQVAPCGGDIVGDWTIVDACLSFDAQSPLGDFCASATVDAGGIDSSGMVSFRSDLTYSATITLSGTIALNIPTSCLTIEGVTLTCAQLDQAAKQALIDDPDPSIQSISCAGSSACVCTVRMTPETSMASGTYTTSGTLLIENGGSESNYCVQGSELHIMSTSMSMGSLTAAGDVVLRKQ